MTGAVAAARALPVPFTLTARAETHVNGRDDLDDTIARLRAFEDAGADVLYAPGLTSAAQVRAIRAATTRPLNVLARPGLDLPELVAAGAGRISTGGALAWVAVDALAGAARRLLAGDLTALSGDARRVAQLREGR